MSAPDLSDYVDVAERIREFYAKHPDGRLVSSPCPDHSREERVCIVGYAYRTADDPLAATGHSWLGIPGVTPFTRGSEVENAETSAIGRAIAFAGIPTKRVASEDEVKSKATPVSPTESSSSAGDTPAWTRQRVGMEAKRRGVKPGDMLTNAHEVSEKPSSEWGPAEWSELALRLFGEDAA